MRFFIELVREIKDWIEFFISMVPGRIGYFLRSEYFKKRLNLNYKNNRFEVGLRIHFPKNIYIGSNSFYGLDCKIYASEKSKIEIGSNITFNSNVMINARGKGSIYIGDDVLIGPNVVIRSNNHSFEKINQPIINQGMTDGNIVINKNVWIGSNCVILPNCEVGEGAIIAAGAIVTSDVEPFTVVGGVPAKLISKRNITNTK